MKMPKEKIDISVFAPCGMNCSNEGEVGKLKFKDAANTLVGGLDVNTVTANTCVFRSALGTTSGKALNEGTGVINALVSDINNLDLVDYTMSIGAALSIRLLPLCRWFPTREHPWVLSRTDLSTPLTTWTT